MRAVTLPQPYASLFVVGLKMTITRSWPAPRSLWAWDGSIEELAIHAAARPHASPSVRQACHGSG